MKLIADGGFFGTAETLGGNLKIGIVDPILEQVQQAELEGKTVCYIELTPRGVVALMKDCIDYLGKRYDIEGEL